MEKSKKKNEEEYEDEEEEEEDDEEDEKKEDKKEVKKEEKKEQIKKEEIKKKEKKKEEKDEEEEEEEEDDEEEEKSKDEKKSKETKKDKEKNEEESEEEEDEKSKNTEEEKENEIEDEEKSQIKEEKKSKNSKDIKSIKEEIKNEKESNKESIDNNNDIKSNKATRPPTITKFNITKSSSNSNIFHPSSNNNIHKNFIQDDLNTLNAKEIRFKDIYETSKRNFQKQFNIINQKGCYKCKISDLSEDKYIIYSCGHKICEECLIKDLLLLNFKNLENKDHVQFNCICLIGKSPEYPFPEFIEKIKKINELKEQKHQCQNHQNEALKYCKDCELWLCDECISIHDVFNKSHILSIKGVPLKLKCKLHDQFTQFYCLKCNEEICPFCLTKLGKHLDHKNIKFEKFNELSEEINTKLKYKNYEDCEKNLENIRAKNEMEKNEKIEIFKEKIKNLIDKIKIIEENYINQINDKIGYLNYIIDVMKESYKYFYNMISKEKKEFNDLIFLREIAEINNIKSFYTNFDDIDNAGFYIDNFSSKNKLYYSYNIKIDSTPLQYSANFEKIFYKKFKVNQSMEEQKKEIRIKSKYNFQKIHCQEVKYDKIINAYKGNVYSICKIGKDEIAVACGKEIYLLSNLSNKVLNDSLDDYPLLIGHTKNIICMTLLHDNKLVSGGEDKLIKIWNIQNKKLISTISKNYIRIDSLLPYKNNYLLVGAYSTIKIINIETKEEILSLLGHQKSICCIIELYPDILATSSYDNTIKVWDFKNKICEFTLFGHDSPVFCIIKLKDGRLMSGSGSLNKALKIWNLDKKICEFSLVGHKREVRDIKQLRNGLVVTASMDKTIKIWNIHRKICIQTLISHNDVIFSLCVIDKNRFVSGGRDQDIIIWKY